MAFYAARPLVRISRAAYCISTSYLYTCRVRNKLKDGNSTVKMVRHRRRRRRNVNAGEFQLRWEKLLLLSYSTTADSFEVKQEKENKKKKQNKFAALLLIITAAMPSDALTQLYRNKRAYVMIYLVVGFASCWSVYKSGHRVVIIELLVAKNARSGAGRKRITNRHVAVAHAFKLPTTTTLIESSSSPTQVR